MTFSPSWTCKSKIAGFSLEGVKLLWIHFFYVSLSSLELLTPCPQKSPGRQLDIASTVSFFIGAVLGPTHMYNSMSPSSAGLWLLRRFCAFCLLRLTQSELGESSHPHRPFPRSKIPPTQVSLCNRICASDLSHPLSLTSHWPHRLEQSGHLTLAEVIRVLLPRIWTWVKESLLVPGIKDVKFSCTLHRIFASQLPAFRGSGGIGVREEQEQKGEGEWRVCTALGEHRGENLSWGGQEWGTTPLRNQAMPPAPGFHENRDLYVARIRFGFLTPALLWGQFE